MPFSEADYKQLPEELKAKLTKVDGIYYDAQHHKDLELSKQKDDKLSKFEGLNPEHRSLFEAAQSEHNKARLQQAIQAGGIEAYMNQYAAEQLAPVQKQLEASQQEFARARETLVTEQFRNQSYAAMSKAGIQVDHHEAYHALAAQQMQASNDSGKLSFAVAGKSVEDHFAQLVQLKPSLLGSVTSGGAKNQTPPAGQSQAADSLAEANRLYLAGQHNESFAMIDRINAAELTQPAQGQTQFGYNQEGHPGVGSAVVNPASNGGN